MTEEQRATWKHWFADVLELARYLPATTDPDRREYLTALAARSGIPRARLVAFLVDGHQPTSAEVRALADALGMHPLSIAHKADLVSLQDLAAVLGSGHLRRPEELREELEAFQQLPASSISRQSAERRLTSELALVSQLQQQFALTEDEWGGTAAELVKCEIVLEQTPIEAPAWPVGLQPPTGVVPVPEGTILGRPGPTRHRKSEDRPDTSAGD